MVQMTTANEMMILMKDPSLTTWGRLPLALGSPNQVVVPSGSNHSKLELQSPAVNTVMLLVSAALNIFSYQEKFNAATPHQLFNHLRGCVVWRGTDLDLIYLIITVTVVI
jgi:hypothetical protein